jgi:hypothetical protein
MFVDHSVFSSIFQMLEERDEEISRLREAEHDLSMSLDRVVSELQTDIQKSKIEGSALQSKLQVTC